MLGKRRPKQRGKLKYTYGRTPKMDAGTNRRRKTQNSKPKNPEKIKKIKIWIFLALLIAAIGYLIYFLFFSSYFTFTEIKVTQEGLEEKGTIFEPYFDDQKGQNLILIDTKEVEATILNDHPEFENLSISKIYPDTVHIEANKYPLVANIINIVGETQDKHIVNQVGISVQKNTENPNLKYIKIKSEEALDATAPLLSKEKLEYTLEAIEYFEEKFGMEVFDAEYLKKAREIHLRTEKYFYIWLDMENSYTDQLMKLKKVVPKLDIYNTPLSYIDLRISGVSGNKIIYKKR